MKQHLLRYAVLATVAFVPGLALADWAAEPSHTNVSFEVGHLGLTQTSGVFRKQMRTRSSESPRHAR